MISANRSVSVLGNKQVLLYQEVGETVSDEWISSMGPPSKPIFATVQKDKSGKLTHFEDGSERFDNVSNVYLKSKPPFVPDYVEVVGGTGDRYKLIEFDFRDERRYWKMVIGRVYAPEQIVG